MPHSNYTINSINPWRMMLFGSVGTLLPLTLYIILLECLSVTFKLESTDTFSWIIVPVLILSAICGYAGFKFSAFQLTISLDEQGLNITNKPRLFFYLHPNDHSFGKICSAIPLQKIPKARCSTSFCANVKRSLLVQQIY